MSNSDEIASEEEQGEPVNDSVFDFLYHDSRRIASFLSQFDNNGLLTGLTQSESATIGGKRSKKFGLSGNAPLIGGGGIDVELGSGETGNQALERVYDPFWANALQFLDVLEERSMIQRDITASRIGQFVLMRGSLIIADMVPYREIWKSDVIKRFLKATLGDDDDGEPTGNRQQRREQKAKARNAPSKPTEAELVLELLPHLPHSPQINVVSDDTAAWGTVDAAYLSGTFADLSLKHGSKIAGEWAVLGIVDGLPFEADQALTDLEKAMVGMTTDTVTKVPLEIGPNVRQLLGRPLLSYGITPLLVFREVA